jgi:hypothetical protein
MGIHRKSGSKSGNLAAKSGRPEKTDPDLLQND